MDLDAGLGFRNVWTGVEPWVVRRRFGNGLFWTLVPRSAAMQSTKLDNSFGNNNNINNNNGNGNNNNKTSANFKTYFIKKNSLKHHFCSFTTFLLAGIWTGYQVYSVHLKGIGSFLCKQMSSFLNDNDNNNNNSNSNNNIY